MDHNKLWQILKEMGIPDHLTCLLRNLYAGQEARVRTRHATIDWFQTGKGVHQGCLFSPCLFSLYAEYIMRNTGLEEAQAGIKTAGRNTKSLLMTFPQFIVTYTVKGFGIVNKAGVDVILLLSCFLMIQWMLAI